MGRVAAGSYEVGELPREPLIDHFDADNCVDVFGRRNDPLPCRK
jgi:hypothetical protein